MDGNKHEFERLTERLAQWAAEAPLIYAKLGPIKKWWLRRGEKLFVRKEQLTPNTPDNPGIPLYLFWCSEVSEDTGAPHGANLNRLRGTNQSRRDCFHCQQKQLIEGGFIMPPPPFPQVA